MAKKEKEMIKEYTSQNSGEQYTFQKVTPAEWLDIMDEVNANKEKQSRTLYGKVLENIIVKPQKQLNDFDDFAEVDEVVTAAIRFQRGK